jgi:hypothetical protein
MDYSRPRYVLEIHGCLALVGCKRLVASITTAAYHHRTTSTAYLAPYSLHMRQGDPLMSQVIAKMIMPLFESACRQAAEPPWANTSHSFRVNHVLQLALAMTSLAMGSGWEKPPDTRHRWAELAKGKRPLTSTSLL